MTNTKNQNTDLPQFFHEFVTEKAIMTLFGLEDKKEIDYLVNQKQFPAIKLKGSKRCYHTPSVKKWLLEHQINQIAEK